MRHTNWLFNTFWAAVALYILYIIIGCILNSREVKAHKDACQAACVAQGFIIGTCGVGMFLDPFCDCETMLKKTLPNGTWETQQ